MNCCTHAFCFLYNLIIPCALWSFIHLLFFQVFLCIVSAFINGQSIILNRIAYKRFLLFSPSQKLFFLLNFSDMLLSPNHIVFFFFISHINIKIKVNTLNASSTRIRGQSGHSRVSSWHMFTPYAVGGCDRSLVLTNCSFLSNERQN